jgi:protein-tyrosine phosphatase
MIDWHSHILPGLDDGAETLEDSLAMGRLLVQVGFTKVHCTPHCLTGMYDNSPADVRDACSDLQTHFDREDIPLQLFPGMEYCLDEFFPDYVSDLQPLGDSRFVLVESSSRASTQLLKENVFLVKRAGFEPLIAHPERHAFLAPPVQTGVRLFTGLLNRVRNETPVADFAETPIEELINMGCSFQCNLGSVAGYYGRLVQKQARRFIRSRLYHCIGSDIHHFSSASGFLSSAIQEVRAGTTGLLLTND